MAIAQTQKTHCKQGHPLSGENLYMYRNIRGCRQCRRLSTKKFQARGNLSRETVEKIIDSLRDGKTINNLTSGRIGRQGRIPGLRIVQRETLHAFCKNNPKIGKLITKIGQQNAHLAQSNGARNQRLIAAPAILRQDGEIAFRRVNDATRNLPESIRHDVQSEMYLALAEGRLRPTDIDRRVNEFVSKQNRMFSAFVPVIGGYMRSLDTPLFDDSKITLTETITTGLWS